MDETRDNAAESEEEEDCFEPIEKRKFYFCECFACILCNSGKIIKFLMPNILQCYPCSASRLAVTSHGINAGDVKKLQEDGVYTCNGLLMRTKKV